MSAPPVLHQRDRQQKNVSDKQTVRVTLYVRLPPYVMQRLQMLDILVLQLCIELFWRASRGLKQNTWADR